MYSMAVVVVEEVVLECVQSLLPVIATKREKIASLDVKSNLPKKKK